MFRKENLWKRLLVVSTVVLTLGISGEVSAQGLTIHNGGDEGVYGEVDQPGDVYVTYSDSAGLSYGTTSNPTEVTIKDSPRIETIKTVSRKEISPGETATYTITVYNPSFAYAENVVVQDRLPEYLTLVENSLIASKGSVTCSDDGVISWKIATLEPYGLATLHFAVQCEIYPYTIKKGEVKASKSNNGNYWEFTIKGKILKNGKSVGKGSAIIRILNKKGEKIGDVKVNVDENGEYQFTGSVSPPANADNKPHGQQAVAYTSSANQENAKKKK
jgi:uncharacterized repeat protein (TIGR01451 family)